MRKADDLRAVLSARLPDLTRNPDLFWIEVKEGRIRATNSAGRGFEWSYTLELTLLDATVHPSLVFLLVSDWLKTNQPDQVQPGSAGFAFEADRVDSEKVDLVIRLHLTETVVVTTNPDGSASLEHIAEPDYAALLGDAPLAGATPVPFRSLSIDGTQVWPRPGT